MWKNKNFNSLYNVIESIKLLVVLVFLYYFSYKIVFCCFQILIFLLYDKAIIGNKLYL